MLNKEENSNLRLDNFRQCRESVTIDEAFIMKVLTLTCFTLFFVVLECVPIKVTIYYEALCGDSVRFITRQLSPNYTDIEQYVDIEFVPYGKAMHRETNGQFQFSCQHGPIECLGNKYQSCVLAQNNGQLKDVLFVNCIMGKRNASDFSSVQLCAGHLDLDMTKIKTCAESTEGDRLLARNGDKTWRLEPSISFVPTIVFDGIYDRDAQNQSLEDFVAVVCGKINGDKPAICKDRKLPQISGWSLF